MSRTLRAAGLVLVLGAASGTAGAGAAALVLRRQARAARALIGQPFGEQAPASDKVFRTRSGDTLDLLMLGDSIAAGLGAERAKHTLGAHLARRVASRTGRAVRLTTAARVGAESSMLRAQLAGLPAGWRPDVAVIVVGGNDVTHRVPASVSCAHLAEAVSSLHERGTAVVVGTCPDLSALTALPQPLRSLAGRSSRRLATAQRDAVTGLGGIAVSLADVVGPFFVTQPDAMFALDRFHPSDAGHERTAKAILPSVLVALGHGEHLPFGHHGPRAP